jgi:hypothetical protein
VAEGEDVTQYSERELVLPTLALLDRYEAGLTTSDLIRELTAILRPDGPDGEILTGRNDTYFSQKVRNLVSHRTLAGPGFETYDADRQHHSITPAGSRFLAEARERGDLAQQLIPGPTLPPFEVFPDYLPVNETPATKQREPFSVDPNEVDRALGAHAMTQNALAAWIRTRGLTPLRSAGSTADFDLAWDDGVTFSVAEVKSLTPGNETGQLRLGLGQVLHYAMLLGSNGRAVRPVLAVERPPTDRRWIALCAAHGVVLVWPGEFDRLEAAVEQ